MKRLAMSAFLLMALAQAQEMGQEVEGQAAVPMGGEEPQPVEAPVILASGKGNGGEEKQVLYSGDSSSDMVKNHRAKRAQSVEKINPETKGMPDANAPSQDVFSCMDGGKPVFADNSNKDKFTNCKRIAKAQTQLNAKTRLSYSTDNSGKVSVGSFNGGSGGGLTVVDSTGAVVSSTPAIIASGSSSGAPISMTMENGTPSFSNVGAPSGAPMMAANSGTCSGAVVFQGNTYIFNDREPCPIPASVFQARKPLEALPAFYLPPAPNDGAMVVSSQDNAALPKPTAAGQAPAPAPTVAATDLPAAVSPPVQLAPVVASPTASASPTVSAEPEEPEAKKKPTDGLVPERPKASAAPSAKASAAPEAKKAEAAAKPTAKAEEQKTAEAAKASATPAKAPAAQPAAAKSAAAPAAEAKPAKANEAPKAEAKPAAPAEPAKASAAPTVSPTNAEQKPAASPAAAPAPTQATASPAATAAQPAAPAPASPTGAAK